MEKAFEYQVEVTREKIEKVKQLHLQRIQKNNRLIFHYKLKRNKLKNFFHTSLQVFLLPSSFLLFFIVLMELVSPTDPNSVCAPDNSLLFQSAILAIFSYLLVVKEKQFFGVIIGFMSKRVNKASFKQINSEDFPFIANYQFKDGNCIYKRKLKDSEKEMCNVPFVGDIYDMQDDFVLIYDLKKKSFPAYVFCKNIEHTPNLEMFLMSLGLQSINHIEKTTQQTRVKLVIEEE